MKKYEIAANLLSGKTCTYCHYCIHITRTRCALKWKMGGIDGDFEELPKENTC
jgi:hypothetical protein